jgi:hypothetical protein
MLGDELNDAGAFEQSEVAVAITEKENHFLPSCNVIILYHALSPYCNNLLHL